MKSFISYAKLQPDTINGYKIAVTQTYSSFDEEEIKDLEKYLQNTIGDGLLIDSQTEREGK